MASGSTLAEAISFGEGVERPFRCESHDDNSASASVNVLKGLWVCFACGAAGRTEGKARAPSAEELEFMLAPEVAPRIYPVSYLELFANDLGNFADRFPDWLRWHAGLGCDPLSGDATFPVHTPNGLLAGVGRRRFAVDDGPRYHYPPRWSAARSAFIVGQRSDILVLTEGAADATSIAEVGAYAFGCYGAGVHAPQLELLNRLAPKLVLLAFDADDAGHRATYGSPERRSPGAKELLERSFNVEVVNWAEIAEVKDPAELPVDARLELLTKFVTASGYAPARNIEQEWKSNVTELVEAHQKAMEEG